MQLPPDRLAALTNRLACARCGYSLRGLNPAGVCPECGLPLSQTVDLELERGRRGWKVPYALRPWPAHRPLAVCRPGWLAAVAGGLVLLTAARAVLFVSALPSRPASRWMGGDPEVVLACVALTYAARVWLTTRPNPDPDPAAAGDGRPELVRRRARQFCPAAVASAALAWLSWRVSWWHYDQFQWAARLVGLGCAASEGLVFRHLAYLVGGTGLPRLIRYYRAAAPAAAGAAVLYCLTWPPGAAGQVYYSPERFPGACLPVAFVAFAYPTLLLVVMAPLVAVAWARARRKERPAPA